MGVDRTPLPLGRTSIKKGVALVSLQAVKMAALPEGIEAIAVCRVPFESTDEVELSLTPGDKVLITRLEVGGGWLEGMLQGGWCLSVLAHYNQLKGRTHSHTLAHVALWPSAYTSRTALDKHHTFFLMLEHQRRPISMTSI